MQHALVFCCNIWNLKIYIIYQSFIFFPWKCCQITNLSEILIAKVREGKRHNKKIGKKDFSRRRF